MKRSGGTLAGLVGVEFDVVVLGDAAALSFEPTNALPDLVEVFRVRGLDSPSESLVSASSTFGEALDDTAFLGGAFLGKAVKAHLLSVLGQHLVQMHAVTPVSMRTAASASKWRVRSQLTTR